VDALWIVSLSLSGVIGFTLGVFGGGGSILAVPMLVFVLRVAPSVAVGMSLAIVGTTSLVASYVHHGRGQVRPKVAFLFGGAGIPTAFLAAHLTHLVAGQVLMLSFAALMVLVGGWMLKGATRVQSDESRDMTAVEARRPQTLRALLAGAVVGGVTGFLGVGGGFLVVPALVAFAGLGLREAVGTSLLVIALNSAAGFVGHLGSGGPNLGLVAAPTLAAVVGALVGERTGRALSVGRLRSGFAVFVILAGVAVAASSINGAQAREPTLRARLAARPS